MAGDHERSEKAAEGSSELEPFGHWPNINLIMDDGTGPVDYGYTPTALAGEEDDSAPISKPAGDKRTRTFDVHTQLELDATTFDAVRDQLRLGTKRGRQEAYRILRESAEFKRGKGAARKMIKEALEGL